jgi:hypothetical protein
LFKISTHPQGKVEYKARPILETLYSMRNINLIITALPPPPGDPQPTAWVDGAKVCDSNEQRRAGTYDQLLRQVVWRRGDLGSSLFPQGRCEPLGVLRELSGL